MSESNQDDKYYFGVAGFYDTETPFYTSEEPWYNYNPQDYNLPSNHSDIDFNAQFRIVPGGSLVISKTTQTFVGANNQDEVVLSALAHSGTLEVFSITPGPQKAASVLVEGYHYVENLNSDGFVESIGLVGEQRWSSFITYLVKFSSSVHEDEYKP